MTTPAENLTKKLKEAAAQVTRYETLTESRKSLQQERARLITDLTRAEKTLQKARHKSARLARFSLQRLFYTLTGKLEDAIQQSNAALQEAQNNLARLEHNLRQVEADLNHIEKQLDSLYNAKPIYNALLEQKARQMREKNTSEGTQLHQIESRIARVERLIDEVEQALEAGKRAQTALRKLDDALDSASAWGGLDIIGGGMLVSIVKHSRLDEAEEAGRYAATTLAHFKKELADIQENLLNETHFDIFEQIADIVLDGILPDLWVQSKIDTWRKQERSLIANVETALRKLNANHEALRTLRQALNKQRAELILNAE